MEPNMYIYAKQFQQYLPYIKTATHIAEGVLVLGVAALSTNFYKRYQSALEKKVK